MVCLPHPYWAGQCPPLRSLEGLHGILGGWEALCASWHPYPSLCLSQSSVPGPQWMPRIEALGSDAPTLSCRFLCFSPVPAQPRPFQEPLRVTPLSPHTRANSVLATLLGRPPPHGGWSSTGRAPDTLAGGNTHAFTCGCPRRRIFHPHLSSPAPLR